MEIVRQAFELGLDASAERYWDANIEYHEDPRWPGASSYRGREAVLKCWRGYFEALGDENSVSIAVRPVDANERGVVAIVRYNGHAPSGLPYEHTWGYVIQVKDRLIADIRAYYEPAQALEAVGLAE